MQEYALTQQGDPICLSEYATDIVGTNTNTHLVLLEDFSSGSHSMLGKDHVNPNAEFNEFVLKSREGRSRLSYALNIKTRSLCNYFKQSREKWDQHVF